jgi:exonuclease III
MKFIQINLHHIKAATAALCQRLAEGKADVALIQEPWLYKGQVRGLTSSGWTVYSTTPEGNVRSYIYVRNDINASPLLEFCSRDTTTVRVTYASDGGYEELIVTSSYLPYDSDEPPPSKEVRDIVEHWQDRKKQLIIGCDANSHHIL